MYKTWEGPLHHKPGLHKARHKVDKPHVLANCRCSSNCVWGHALCRRHGYVQNQHTLRISSTHTTHHPLSSHKSTTTTDHLHQNQQTLWFKIAVVQAQQCSIPSLPPAVPSGVKVDLSCQAGGAKGSRQHCSRQQQQQQPCWYVHSVCAEATSSLRIKHTPGNQQTHKGVCWGCVKNLAAARKI